jgi:DNA polymerase-3 subunit epsilon
MSWLERTMVGFDTETTGVDVATDRIVTAAVIFRDGADGAVSARTWLIDPGVEIPERATAVHGITTEMARANGADPVIALGEIAALLAAALANGSPIVAFNAGYDLGILDAELARHRLPSLARRIGAARTLRPVVDPLVLDRHLDRFRRGKRKLIDLCEHYGVTVDAEALHAADADVLATLDLVQAMARAYPTLATADLSDLHDQQVSAHRTWAVEFRAWLVSRGRSEDLPDLDWPLPLR